MRTTVAAVLLIFSAPSFANDNARPQAGIQASGDVESEKKVVEERKVCKRIQATESRLAAKKICMTKAQWREYEAS